MSIAILSCEFLISPATCNEGQVEDQITDLIEAAKCVDDGANPPVLEPNALERLITAGKYPTEGLFKSNLARCEIDTYSSKDVARIVNLIISKAGDMHDIVEQRLTEWTKKNIMPALVETWPNRAKELENLFEHIALQDELGGSNASVVHHCDANLGPQFVVSGELSEIYPATLLCLPHPVSRTIQTHRNFKEYLSTLNHHQLFSCSVDDFNVKLSFYVGALKKVKSLGASLDDISLESFDLGPEFLDSLRKNQCAPGGPFAGVLVDTIADLLAERPKNPISIFRKSAGSSEARTYGTLNAYRTHVTKSGIALRLMFWRGEDRTLILANVGPKSELVIERPF